MTTKSETQTTTTKTRRKNVVSVQLTDEQVAIATVIHGSPEAFITAAIDQFTVEVRTKLAAIRA